MAKTLTLKKACLAALRGESELALDALHKLCTCDNKEEACLSLIEMLAFYGKWQDIIPLIGKYLDRPPTIGLGGISNVYSDCFCLLIRAGLQTGSWGEISELCEQAIHSLDLYYERLGLQLSEDFQRDMLQEFADQAKQGKAPPCRQYIRDKPGFDDEQRYLKGIEMIPIHRADLLSDAFGMANHKFMWAYSMHQDDEALDEYFKSQHHMMFGKSLSVARILIDRGDTDLAWEVVIEKLPEWWPLSIVQIAPVELLYDQDLFKMMTPERCEQVLKTPRGPAAAEQ